MVLAHAGIVGLISGGFYATLTPPLESEPIFRARVIVQALQPPTAPLPSSPIAPLPPKSAALQSVATPLPDLASLTSPASAAIISSSPVIDFAPMQESGDSATQVGNHNSTNPTTPAASVVLPSSNADYLNNPAPTYPRLSRRMGEEGTVVLSVFINAEGQAERLQIHNSSGHSRLDEAALSTVKRWHFVPGKIAGVPAAMWFKVPIRFVLND